MYTYLKEEGKNVKKISSLYPGENNFKMTLRLVHIYICVCV